MRIVYSHPSRPSRRYRRYHVRVWKHQYKYASGPTLYCRIFTTAFLFGLFFEALGHNVEIVDTKD